MRIERGLVVGGDNLDVMARLPDGCADLVYIDPPFNTGRARVHTRLRTVADAGGDRTGFAGRRYRSVSLGTSAYLDVFDDYLDFLEPRLRELRRLLALHGSIYVHLDWRESHYVKVLGDAIFGRDHFLNEVVWAYDYGGRARRRWPPKHDVLLVWVRDRRRYWFDDAEVDRIPYMAPALVGAAKAARGKLPTDTWWHTIVPTSGRERTGYPTQKPLGVLRRVVAASCPPGGLVVDAFAGSGTAGAAALELGRRFVCIDDNPQALQVMRRRFGSEPGVAWEPAGAGLDDT
jgi:site-specific DNA-methyltransferase (adenine-specific)